METRADDVTKTDSGKKATHDSEKSKAEDSQSEAGRSSLPDAISSIADPDPIKGSKSDSNNGSTKNDGSKNLSSSGSSQTGTSVTDSSSTENVDDGTDSSSAILKNVGDTGKNLVTDKTNHGKSNSDHKDTQGTDSSTDAVSSTNGTQTIASPAQLVDQAKSLDTRLASANAEVNAPAGDSAGLPAVAFALDNQGTTAALSSVAATITKC